MKAVQIVKPNELKLIDMEKPVITEKDNVLVKMTAAGICGSDVGIYHGTNAAATYPRVIGHEMVGRVDEVGPNVKGLKPGDRVIINQVTSCGHCYPARLDAAMYATAWLCAACTLTAVTGNILPYLNLTATSFPSPFLMKTLS